MDGKIVHRHCFVLPEPGGKKEFFKMGREARLGEDIWAIEIYGGHELYFMILDFALASNNLMGNDTSKWLEDFGPLDGNKEVDGHKGLERIFKKNGDEGQVRTTSIEKFKRAVMTLELEHDDELVQEYKRLHLPENIWPQILMNMDTIGVFDMEIYLKGYRAFLIMDTRPDFDLEKDGQQWAAMPSEKEWQAHVAQFQKTDAKSKAAEKWKIMPRVFTI